MISPGLVPLVDFPRITWKPALARRLGKMVGACVVSQWEIVGIAEGQPYEHVRDVCELGLWKGVWRKQSNNVCLHDMIHTVQYSSFRAVSKPNTNQFDYSTMYLFYHKQHYSTYRTLQTSVVHDPR